MDPSSVRAVDRVPHGGSTDRDRLDVSANVNPESPDGTRAVYETALENARRYPDDGYPAYRRAAAAYVGCSASSVVPTPGGLAGLRLALATHVEPGDRVAVPAPGFGEYDREVRLQGGHPVHVPEDEILRRDPTGVAAVIVCNPNNPTGHAYRAETLRTFAGRCRSAATILIVDEAFLGFTDEPSMAGEPGTIVVRSLTKLFGLPGIRAGFAVATGPSLDRLTIARRTWNLSTPAAAVGTHVMGQGGFIAATKRRVRRERERFREALADDYEVRPSSAPFLLLAVPGGDVDAVVEGLLERAIVVRDARTFRGLDRHVRVAIKDAEANDRLLEGLRAVAPGRREVEDGA